MEKIRNIFKKENKPHRVHTSSLKEALKLHREGHREVILRPSVKKAHEQQIPSKEITTHPPYTQKNEDENTLTRFEFVATEFIQTIPDPEDPSAERVIQWFLYGGEPPIDHSTLPDTAKEAEITEDGSVIFPGVIEATQITFDPNED